MRAGTNPTPCDLALQSRAHRLPDVSRSIEPKAAFVRCGDDSSGDGVVRRLLEGANDAKRLVNAPAGRVSIRRMCAPPTVSVPVLSKMTVRVRASASSASPPFIRMPRRAARATPASICDRSGEDQRAWGRCHEDGKPANRIAGKAPRNSGESERDGQKQEREPVRHPDGRRLGGLRCRRHPHDAGVGAFAFCCRRLKRKRLTCR